MHRLSVLILTATIVGAVSMGTAQAAVEYVKICSAFGAQFFYIPGTDICYNADTGETKRATAGEPEIGESTLAEEARNAKEGVALSLALPNATVGPGKTSGAAVNIGTFDGEAAIGVSGAFQTTDGFTINGAVGLGLGRGTLGGRAGVNFSW